MGHIFQPIGWIAGFYRGLACEHGSVLLRDHPDEGILTAICTSPKRWHLYVVPKKKSVFLECEECLTGDGQPAR
jgi:hypothetical protein